MRYVFAWLCLFLALTAVPALAAEDTPALLVPPVGEADLPTEADDALLEVHLLNVGWADCILLRQGSQTMLIDCGHAETGGVVLDYLAAIGIDHLNYALLTHYHNDHIGGFLQVFAEIPVDLVLLPEGFEDFSSLLYDELMDQMETSGLTTHTVTDGDSMRLGDATLVFYQWQEPKAGMNDRSVVTMARFGERAILFAADIENNAQKALAEIHGDALDADIIKMPHHGLAAYMREFHRAAQPLLVTYSNAKHKIIRNIELTEQRGVDWMLTTQGTIVAVTDGKTWQVRQLPLGTK